MSFVIVRIASEWRSLLLILLDLSITTRTSAGLDSSSPGVQVHNILFAQHMIPMLITTNVLPDEPQGVHSILLPSTCVQ